MAVEERETTTEEEAAPALSVSAAMGLAKNALEEVVVRLVGEVSEVNDKPGYKAVYFTVKDEKASLPCMMWMNRYQASGVALSVGALVELTGRFSLYAAKGRMNFDVFSVSLAGEGQLRLQVANLARELEAMGLMDPARKRPLPAYPETIGLVTSPRGAAVHDVLRTLRRRYPLARILFAGVPVEGPGAADGLVDGLAKVVFAGAEVVLLVRGGGSFEDLMTFNDESLCRAVASCPVPVITGIGHEPDWPIVDDVSDRRASTPTGAAESVAPALDEIVGSINTRRERLSRAIDVILEQQARGIGQQGLLMERSMSSLISHESLRVEALANRRCLADPMTIVTDRETSLMQAEQRLLDALPRSLERSSRELDGLAGRMSSATSRIVRPYEARVGSLAATLDALSPLKVLGRGYAIARDSEGHVVTSAASLSEGDAVSVRLGEGSFEATVCGVSTQ